MSGQPYDYYYYQHDQQQNQISSTNPNHPNSFHQPNLKNKTHVSVRKLDHSESNSKLKVKPLQVSPAIHSNHYHNQNQNKNPPIQRNESLTKGKRRPPPKVPTYSPVTYSAQAFSASKNNNYAPIQKNATQYQRLNINTNNYNFSQISSTLPKNSNNYAHFQAKNNQNHMTHQNGQDYYSSQTLPLNRNQNLSKNNNSKNNENFMQMYNNIERPEIGYQYRGQRTIDRFTFTRIQDLPPPGRYNNDVGKTPYSMV